MCGPGSKLLCSLYTHNPREQTNRTASLTRIFALTPDPTALIFLPVDLSDKDLSNCWRRLPNLHGIQTTFDWCDRSCASLRQPEHGGNQKHLHCCRRIAFPTSLHRH